MNVVNQLWSRVSSYYRTLNPATLSGAIDVIVVVQHDGSLRSSPFHARFGKSGILRPQDNVVDLYVNDELVPDIQMKLGEAGEAFFLVDPAEAVPEFAAAAATAADAAAVVAAIEQRRGAANADEDDSMCNTGDADDDESGASDSGGSGHDVQEQSAATRVSYYSDCEGEERGGGIGGGGGVGAGSRRGTLTGYKSDSENDSHGSSAVVGGAADQLVAQLDWEWGQLPHSATMDSVRTADYYDCSDEPASTVGEAFASTTTTAVAATTAIKLSGELVSSEKLNKILEERIISGPSGNDAEEDEPGTSLREPRRRSSRDQRERLSSSGGECYLSDLDDSNRHLYLSGSPSSPESGYKSDQDMSTVEEDLNIGVQLSLCGGLDLPNSITTERFLKHLVSYDEFLQNPDLTSNRNLVVRIQGKNYNWPTAAPILLCRAAFRVPLPFKTVQSLKERHMRFRRKRNMVRSWFGWGGARSADQDAEDEAAAAGDEATEVVVLRQDSIVAKVKDIKEVVIEIDEDSQGQAKVEHPRQMVRTVRLSSSQLQKLNLRPGYNELRYSITTKYQGTTECTCGVYLWNHDDRLVISDIDGTITKSDVLGHILPMVGKDWTQPRIAKLFSAIEHNDYRFVYLSARAIGQSAITRRFLQRVRQEGVQLPDGPVLLSPLSLVRAFHQEVIARRPEAFKIACLKDVRALFPEAAQPFWAGFGNRPSDALSYTEVGVNRARCFTVNTQGEVNRQSGACLPSSYQALADVADLVFPPFQHCFADHGHFSHFSYWRDPMPELAEFEAAAAASSVVTDADAEAAAALNAVVAAVEEIHQQQQAAEELEQQQVGHHTTLEMPTSQV